MALRNRWLAELTLFAGLAVLHTWPLITDPVHLSRIDNDDTMFNTWVIAWVSHQLFTDPMHLFEAPIFFPAHDALAFSEHMVVQATIAAPALGLGASPVLAYNLLVLLGHTLSAFAMCAVVRRWTASPAAGIVAGCLFSFNAHLLTRFAHLQALHVEFLPLALYAFDAVLRGAGPRMAAVFAAAFVLQALCSNYSLVLVATALIVSMAVRPELWDRTHRVVWLRLTVAGAAVAIALLPFLLPYYRVRTEQGLVRTIDDVRLYSAGWQDYLTTAGRLHYEWWSHRVAANRTPLFPGVIGFALATVAFARGTAWRDSRARMALAFGSVGFALSFGPSLPGYAWMHEHIPLLQGVRAAARWGFLPLTAVAILAGFGVRELHARWHSRSWWMALVIALVGGITLEALRAPIAYVPFAGIPSIHRRLSTPDVVAIAVFPIYAGERFHQNARYMLDQTRHWRPMVDAYSSFAPDGFFARAERLQSFPDAASIQDLRAIGVSHVVIHRQAFAARSGPHVLAELRAHPDLQFVVEQDDVIIYKIRPRQPGE